MLIKINNDIPLHGCIAFGIIDRGTNLIQIRPTSICNLRCIYCSVSANDKKIHPYEFEVELDYLVNEVKKVVELKGEIEANIDSVGEPLMYPKIVELVKKLKEIKGVKRISMQTNGILLTKDKVDEFINAGLDRLNLSINSLDKELAKYLSGGEYDLDKILEIIRYANIKLELLLAPVWIPKINDEEIPKIIKLAKELKCKIGIQNYEVYKHGRKVKSVKPLNFYKFYKQLETWEKEFDIKLKLSAKDFEIKESKRVPITFKKGEKVRVKIKIPGWMEGQMTGVAKDRCITILDCNKKANQRRNVRILSNKDGIYVAK